MTTLIGDDADPFKLYWIKQKQEMGCGLSSEDGESAQFAKPQIFFVLGGPGSGKGTQCENLVRDYKFKHLSAGDLLREEQQKGGPDAEEIQKNIKNGTLVKSDLIVRLLKKAIAINGNRRYLIDGFPRNKENLTSFEAIIGNEVEVRKLIYFECSEKCMVDRITERGKTSGRADDNPETIKMRLATFTNETVPVVQQFQLKGKVIRVNAEKGKDVVCTDLYAQLTMHGINTPTPPIVYFVVGGPGSGKGTQCENLVKDYGFKHLSTGDLLRDSKKRGSKEAALIESYIKDGKLVPSESIIALIKQAMERNNFEGKYLIDGLPRNQENVDAWDKGMKSDVSVKGLIYFKCSDEVMQARLLERGKTSGRSDDNIDTIKKRFETFHKETEPVINDFKNKGLVVQVNAEKGATQVYTELKNKLADKGVNPKPKSGNPPQVIFVLGGPGSGKGTQCDNMVRDFGFNHLSTGELLRDEQKQNGINAQLIDEYVKGGKLVPSEILVRLVKKHIRKIGSGIFLLDGFPRNTENIEAWDSEIGSDVDVRNMIFFECSQKVMEQRLLERGKSSGRADDNPDTIKKRFETFVKETEPVVKKYESQGLVIKVNAERGKEEVYTDLKAQLIAKGYKPK